MTDVVRHRISTALFVLLCVVGALSWVAETRGWRNELSNVDRYSEANILREVRNFNEQGLTRHLGLGNVLYPGMYPNDGFARPGEDTTLTLTPDGIYTHYPPGPEYLLYAAEKLFGSEPVSTLRVVPIAVGWCSLLFLGLAIGRRFGDAIAWMVLGACAITPSVVETFTGLHYQGYALALLMLEIGIVMSPGSRVTWFAVLGFAQGWLSFDYVFLVTFVPLAFEFVLSRVDADYQPRWRLAAWRVALAGAGFVAAHMLHFAQVWAYWGSFDAAARDLAGAATHRSGSGLVHGPLEYLLFEIGLLKLYYLGLHPVNLSLSLPDPGAPENWSMFRFLGLALGPWWALVTVSMLIWDRVQPSEAFRAFRMDWHAICLTALLTSSAWFFVMLDHAGHHRHFLFRHLFFVFFCIALFAAVRLHQFVTKITLTDEPLPRHSVFPVSDS